MEAVKLESRLCQCARDETVANSRIVLKTLNDRAA
jgi:hypothetical protein